jgi:hypothetical protein
MKMKHYFSDAELLILFELARVALQNPATYAQAADQLDLSDETLLETERKVVDFLNDRY